MEIPDVARISAALPAGIRLKNALQSIIVPVGTLILWELAVRTHVLPNTLIAAPSQAFKRLLEMLLDMQLVGHALVSLKRLLLGFLLGVSMGILTGTLVGASRTVARLIEPSLLSLIPIPAIAWIPLLIILFGIGDLPKILLIAIGGFCVLFLNTAHGIRGADRNFVDVALVLGKSRTSLIRNVLFPSALPGILAGMRVSMALSWTLLISSEVIASSKGLGWLIWNARNFSLPEDLIVGMVAIAILGALSDRLLAALHKYTTRWSADYESITSV